MKKTELKQLVKKLVKEIIEEGTMAQLPSSDQRIKLDVLPNRQGDLVVKYRGKDVGILSPSERPEPGSMDAFGPFSVGPKEYSFASNDKDFKALNGMKGNLERLNLNLVRLVDFRLEKKT